MSENSYLRHFSAQLSQIVFLPYFTVLRLITTVWPEMSENSYLQHFSAKVSQIVFFASLTVLQLITTLWPEISENSYLSDFSAQVSEIVLLGYLTVLRLITTVWLDLKCQKTHISAISVHKYHKSCSSLISPFNGLLQHYDLKFSENSYLRYFSAQVSQIVFLAYLTVLRLFTTVITTVWPEMSENLYLRHFSTQVSHIVLSAYLTVFTTYYNCMTWNVRKLISPPFQCTSITNCVLSLFDRFTTYYNCKT